MSPWRAGRPVPECDTDRSRRTWRQPNGATANAPSTPQSRGSVIPVFCMDSTVSVHFTAWESCLRTASSNTLPKMKQLGCALELSSHTELPAASSKPACHPSRSQKSGPRHSSKPAEQLNRSCEDSQQLLETYGTIILFCPRTQHSYVDPLAWQRGRCMSDF